MQLLLLCVRLRFPFIIHSYIESNNTEIMLIENEHRGANSSRNSVFGEGGEVQKPGKIPRHIKLNYWTPEEQTVYLNYLKKHMPMIASQEYRKKNRIFKKVSALLGTRTPIQVKSHHQKLEDKYKNLSKIIAHLEKELRVGGQEKETEETESAQSPADSSVEEAGTPLLGLDFLLGERPFFEVDYPENHIHVTFVMDEDSLLI